MICFTRMLEHVLVHKTATEHVLTRQTQPVFTRVLAPEKVPIFSWTWRYSHID